MGDFINGIFAYFKALSFISSNGLSRYFLYSGLIGVILFSGSFLLIYSSAPLFVGWLASIIPWEIDINMAIYQWIPIIFYSYLFLSLFKYLMLILTAPLMSALSEKVEYIIQGTSSQKNVVLRIIPDLVRGLRINLRNIIRELFATLFLLVLGFIPIVGLISGFLIIIVQGYYAGFGNHDFWAERHFSYRNTIRFMKRNKGMLAGNGIVYVFMIAIPILGAFFVPPLATVAATMEGLKKLEEIENINSIDNQYL